MAFRSFYGVDTRHQTVMALNGTTWYSQVYITNTRTNRIVNVFPFRDKKE